MPLLAIDSLHDGNARYAVIRPLADPSRRRPRSGREFGTGLSISNLNGNVGTLGAFVEDAKGRVAIVSNCHVLAPYGSGVTDPKIYQPGKQDVEELLASHAIATLKNHTTFSKNGACYLDAAYALLDGNVQPEPGGNIIPQGCPNSRSRIDEVVEYEQLGPNKSG